MKYDKRKKIEKLKTYKREVNIKERNIIESRKSPGKNLSKTQRKILEKKIIQNT